MRVAKKGSGQSFDGHLLQSSAKLGQGKLTAKEKATRALLEERAGIQQSDPSARLYQEETSSSLNSDASMEQESNQSDDELLPVTNTSLLSRAFAKKDPMVQIYEASSQGTTTQQQDTEATIVKNSELESAFKKRLGSALKGPLAGALKKPELGSALKKNGVESTAKNPYPSLKGSALKRKADQNSASKKKPSTSSKSESEDSSSDEDAVELTGKSSLWNADVVKGEESISKTITIPVPSKPKEIMEEKIDRPIEPIRPAFYVHVERKEDIQLARMALPVVAEEQHIMETIMANNITILCGETGSCPQH